MTDASIMFGKGIPMSKTEIALDRAAYLIQQLAGGQIVRGQVDVRSRRIYKKDISFDYDHLYDLLGIEIPKNTVKSILTKLDFIITDFSDTTLTVQIPDYRIDIEYPEDIYEEVGRIYGYDQIPEQIFSMPVTPARPELSRRYKNKIIRYLYNQGWSEVYSYNFTSLEDTTSFGFDPELSYELENPVDQQQNLLRQTLLPGLIHKLPGWANSGDLTRLFEWGRVMAKKTKPVERDFLSLCFYQKSSNSKQSFLEVKALVMGLLSQGGLKLTDFDLNRAVDVDFDIDYLHPYNSLVITSGSKLIGAIGVIHPQLANQYKISSSTVLAEFNLHTLIPKFNEMITFVEPSKFPVSLFDASFIVDRTTMAQSLIDSATKVGGKYLTNINIFDEYTGPNLGPDQRSISLRFHFQSPDRTLESAEVEEKMQKIFSALEKDHAAILRDK
jgi:phenylalanyl-tRNA synthetase beta chain